MGHCIQHTQCPNCAKQGKDRAGNNLAIYSDNSSFCFSCNYYTTKNNKKTISQSSKRKQRTISLPSDSSLTIPIEIKQNFLTKYGITNEDCTKHSIMWSSYYQRLYFPILYEGELLGYLGRYCGNNPTNPKWYSHGDLGKIIHPIGNETSTLLVLTEDIISAIKVSHLNNILCIPLFGSHISNLQWLRLKLLYPNHKIILWLDKDKEKESIKFVYTGKQLGINCWSVITTEDPKALDELEIKKVLDIYLKT